MELRNQHANHPAHTNTVQTIPAHQSIEEIVLEASKALTSWDADRLEELALSCEALNSDLMSLTPAGRAALAVEAQRAHRHLTVLKRSLHYTRENLKVLKNLRSGHDEQLEYAPGPICDWAAGEREHGNY